jgi:hypothetical protein
MKVFRMLLLLLEEFYSGKMIEDTTTDKVICSGSKLPLVTVSEPLQMSRC